MPAFDRSGPLGQGSLTGRGLGPCGGGMGYGRGFGRGFGYRQPTKIEVESYMKDLEVELKDVKEYLKDLQSKK